MPSQKARAFLLDVQYKTQGGTSTISVYAKAKKRLVLEDPDFKPHFYAVLNPFTEKEKKELLGARFGKNESRITRIEKSDKKNLDNLYTLYFDSTSDLMEWRRELKQEFSFAKEKREYDIPFSRRYLLTKNISPNSWIELEWDEKDGKKIIKKISPSKKEDNMHLKIGVYDLETSSTEGRFSNASTDQILMISYVDDNEQTVFTTKKLEKKIKNLETFENEENMLKEFIRRVKEKELDVIGTYNGDRFDFPYLKERAELFGLKLEWGFDGSEPKKQKKGLDFAVKMNGTQHLDAYQMLLLTNRFAITHLIKFNLEGVYEQLFGIEKEKLTAKQINEIYETGKEFERLVDYNLMDSIATMKIIQRYLDVVIALGKITKLTIFELSRSTSQIMVTNLLMEKAFNEGIVVPNRPAQSEVMERGTQSYKGGHVKEPKPGLHENLAVLDFRSLYPTILISHNISPDTMNCGHKECEQGNNIAPTKSYFCEKRKGFISSVLENLLNTRIALKKKLKKHEKGTEEYIKIYSKQYALKIILNSFYGNLANARFRWYSRESARAVSAWARQYIKEVGEKAEKEGFEVLYIDTDSEFLIIPKGKTKKDVLEFQKKINQGLPGIMEIELQGFYKRGLFVTKKSGKRAAKKRYALVDDNDNLTIVGFEYVRRDWSKIARETQKKVLEYVLMEGKPEKAVDYVKQAIQDLKQGKVPKKDLIIISQIRKKISDYEVSMPHVSAAKRAIQKGKNIGLGSIIEYIVKKGGAKTISDRTEIEEFVKEGEYDPEYYIDHQLLPAVLKIMEELGYSKQDLVQGGKQSSLAAFG